MKKRVNNHRILVCVRKSVNNHINYKTDVGAMGAFTNRGLKVYCYKPQGKREGYKFNK